MTDRSVLLKQLFSMGDFQKLQDKISFATDIAMITVDFTGKPVSAHSGCSEFCKRVREDAVLCENCQKCDSRGGLEAARLSKPYIYICHMGLVDFAIPVFLNNTYVGAVMAGQVRLKAPTPGLERVTNRQNETLLEGALLSLYNAIPSISYDRIEALANMISYLYNYVIKEAAAKLNGLDDYKPALSAPIHKSISTIQKAVDYINDNYNKDIRLEHLSSLCDISPSYFSKLFKKIYKINIASYVNGLRVEMAKSLLSKTNKSIVDVAYEVGYEDCGYFIKNFKKVVGLTPNLYRESVN